MFHYDYAHFNSSIPWIWISEMLMHIWTSAVQYYGSLKPNKQPLNQQKCPAVLPYSFLPPLVRTPQRACWNNTLNI